MINTHEFGCELKNLGYNFYSGVPCSFLKHLINYAINDCTYIKATNEGDAVSIAAGCYLTGQKAVVLMQNSGLTNAVSPITSLLYPFKIPVLGFVSLRGEEGLNDEPQHELMGKITPRLLELMEVEWEYLSDELSTAKQQILNANKIISEGRPFFFVVKKNTFESVILKQSYPKIQITKTKKNSDFVDELPTRWETLKVISRFKDNVTALLATTGKTGRELYEIEDSKNNLYMVGSMGCISSLGLGVALNAPGKKVIVIDGDGSLLMRSGALATIADSNPNNFLHILLDNNTYDSTGGQETVSSNVDFPDLAYSSGYINSIHCHNLSELEDAILNWKQSQSLCFIYFKIKSGSKKDLGRPTVKPFEVKDRLIEFLTSS